MLIFLGNLVQSSFCLGSALPAFIYWLNLLHLVSFYTWMAPPYIEDTVKILQKQKISLSDSLQIRELVLCIFHVEKCSEHVPVFLVVFSWKWKKKACFEIYFRKLSMYVKEQFSKALFQRFLHRNITCAKGVLFKRTTLQVLPLYFLVWISCYNTKN